MHEIESAGKQGEHLVQGYVIDAQDALDALGVRGWEVAVRLTSDVVDQMTAAGIPMPWLRTTLDGDPAVIGTTFRDADDLLAEIGHTLPAGELLIVPRALQEAVPC
ncbi:MAG: hypothetical protein H0X35_03420 [Pseudonocardiales bacterium]|nr:hypothetical protein [Pseudonocardiales bacterium]